MIENPVLRGFNPDPAICRVGDDFYLATSTFEWFPGCRIYHSRDLRHWRLTARPLARVSQLDMRGVPDSCGVWAPCLTHHDGLFYLVYANVRSFQGHWKDTPNYLVTATDITGEWSEPVYLNASGFDASLFHDEDGRCYLLNMLMDHRANRFFGGIVLQEYDRQRQQLVGDVHLIFEGSEQGLTEGPHLYRREGWYYLLTAEGGTGYHHCMSVARSRELTGPYEVHPGNPLISSREAPGAYLQKTGHGGLVATRDGEWYTSFLASRPLSERGRCTLGRESALERIEWRADGWPWLACGGRVARREVEAPALPEHPWPAQPSRVEFRGSAIDQRFQSLRVPMTADWISQTERPGFLRLRGRDSLSSNFDQSLVARRVQSHHSEASTSLEFQPDNFQQMAGLVCYYNSNHYHYLHVIGDDFGRRARDQAARKFLAVTSCNSGTTSEPAGPGLDITGLARVYLRAVFRGADLQFYYAEQEGDWQPLGPVLDGSILSDDYVETSGTQAFYPCFTGAFYGLCCQDLSGARLCADFGFFEYLEQTDKRREREG